MPGRLGLGENHVLGREDAPGGGDAAVWRGAPLAAKDKKKDTLLVSQHKNNNKPFCASKQRCL